MEPTPTQRRAPALVLLAAASLRACRLSPDPAAAATPQRPSVSSDATTAAEGTLELEAAWRSTRATRWPRR